MQRLKLFCFPYAGGSALAFSKWKQLANPYLDIIPVELSGRGRRINEPLYKDLQAAIDDVFQLLYSDLDSSYALFGHSMGGIIAYELCRKIYNAGLPAPQHIFFSGCKAPHIKRAGEKKYSLMNDIDFKKELLGLGGTPPELFEHPQLLEVFIPLLKGDFKIAETELPGDDVRPFDCDITVLLGKDEELSAEQCDGWKRYTKRLCSIHYFNGGHFFLHDETIQIMNIVNYTVSNLKNRICVSPTL